MSLPPRMSRSERLGRLAIGLACMALGYFGFAYSKAHDPANRAAILAIGAFLVGVSWVGQAARGRKDGPIPRDEEVPPGRPVAAERLLLACLGGWLVPGLGHWVLGRRAKAILLFATITGTFALGVVFAQGRNLDFQREAIYFGAYVFNLGETALGALLTRGLERDHVIPLLQMGFLYSAVASLLNLVVLMDLIYTGRYAGAAEAVSGPSRVPEAEPDAGPPGGAGA